MGEIERAWERHHGNVSACPLCHCWLDDDHTEGCKLVVAVRAHQAEAEVDLAIGEAFLNWRIGHLSEQLTGEIDGEAGG